MKVIRNAQNYLKSIKNSIELDLSLYNGILKEINQYHKKIEQYSDSQLIELSSNLKNKARFNQDDIIIEAYALVKEVCIRKLKIIPFDVQIIGAIALDKGKMIEMQTGEGKTLVAVFAAYLNALKENSVHILTFNDYLARRDAMWMSPIYSLLGMSVGYINESMSLEQKNKAYACDITYAPAKEVGFDYLRSMIAYNPNERVIQSFKYAIVDEADAILIDEARNPLVLAGNLIESNIDFKEIASFARFLNYDVDYKTDEYSRNIYLTEKGIEKVESYFKISNLHSDINLELHSAVNLALQAKTLLKRDVDYIVKEGQIKLIDEFTGRVVEYRKWKNGLQTAVEAKENVKINSEGSILNSITLQHLMHKYAKLSGMTATAQQASEELDFFYNLKTVVIPPNKKCIRIDHPDLIFDTKESKNQAIVNEVKGVHEKGQPILIGTLTVKESEELYHKIRLQGIDCQVLNAKNDELEAEIIANAGMLNSVTISTNMAGRGTDIILGGQSRIEKERIEQIGGLYVIGTNRHESLRIDRQLRGRAGRQGDIGSSRFFISLEDDLMIRYKLKDALPKKKRSKYLPVNGIAHIQRVIESQMFDIRRFLNNYSSLIEKQRIIIQNEREITLENKEIGQNVREAILFQYDKLWSLHLDYLSEIKEGIHLLRLGGENPLREFQKKAELAFIEMCNNLDMEVGKIIDYFEQNPDNEISTLGIKKPSSTWTYIINDNPFGNQLGLMLQGVSGIGFQVDFISLILLFFYRLFKSKKKEL
jgi:preprotein translocase subunit SecA